MPFARALVYCFEMICILTFLQAEEITLTIGQAFDLAYRRFLDTQGKDIEQKKQNVLLQKKVIFIFFIVTT